MHDLIIIGGGPAGLTAAIYAIRKRLDVVVVTQDLGGKTMFHMQLPWADQHQVIRGADLVEKFRRELEYLDFAHVIGEAESVSKEGDEFTVRLKGGKELAGRAVILATGSEMKLLGVPGELDYLGKGVSYSATSYAPLFLGKPTVVVGDGMLALRAVAELAQVAESVHVVVPDHGAWDASMARAVAADPEKVVVLEGYRITSIEGEEFVERVRVEGPGGEEEVIPASGVFVEVKLVPNTGPVRGLVDLDDRDRVIVDSATRTSCTGLFAAGDVTNTVAEQVLIAVGEGAKAALSAYEFLTIRPAMEVRV